MGDKKEKAYPEEFIIMKTKHKNLNKDISLFRIQNPRYEVFSISIAGTGGQLGGTMHFHVIWRLKEVEE